MFVFVVDKYYSIQQCMYEGYVISVLNVSFDPLSRNAPSLSA